MHTDSIRTCPQCGSPKSPRAKQCRPCFRSIRQPIDNSNGTHRIPLTKGAFAIIDSADVPLVAEYNWMLDQARDRPDYASRGDHQRTVYLHRFLMSAGPGELVDHVNKDGLDCRRSNMRIATPWGNMANVFKRTTNPNRFKGVRLRHDGAKWCARIQIHGKGIHLGSFDTAEEAARAYDQAAVKLFGDFASLNFP